MTAAVGLGQSNAVAHPTSREKSGHCQERQLAHLPPYLIPPNARNGEDAKVGSAKMTNGRHAQSRDEDQTHGSIEGRGLPAFAGGQLRLRVVCPNVPAEGEVPGKLLKRNGVPDGI